MVNSRNQADFIQVPKGGRLDHQQATVSPFQVAVDHASAPSLRAPTEGPELQLVHEYLDRHIPAPPRGQALTVFLEPEIESGFPDLVAVYWNVAATNQWATCRADLSAYDIRVAHFLATMGERDLEALKVYFRTKVSGALERLHAANLVCRSRGGWRARSLESIFAVRRLVAIEAKIANWRDGLTQAFANTWFASESYLLLPRVPKGSDLLGEAARFGVGVAEPHQPLHCVGVRPKRQQIPLSYASWLFNEWAWRVGVAGPTMRGIALCRSILFGSSKSSLPSQA